MNFNTVFVVGVVAVVFVIVWLIFNFKIAIAISIAVAILLFLISQKDETFIIHSNDDVSADVDIDELHYYLDELEKNRDIVNTSENVEKVKLAMNNVLDYIDIIIDYSESELNSAGMSKSQLPQQKKFIQDNHDIIIKQTKESK